MAAINQGRGLSILIDVGERLGDGKELGVPIHIYRSFCRQPELTVERPLQELRRDALTDLDVQIPDEQAVAQTYSTKWKLEGDDLQSLFDYLVEKELERVPSQRNHALLRTRKREIAMASSLLEIGKRIRRDELSADYGRTRRVRGGSR